MAMNSRIDMISASEKDCAELSPVVFDPEIFLVRRSTRSCAWLTTSGLTPARSSRVFTANRPSAPLNSRISRCDDTFDARYSATPVSTVSSVRMRNPSSRRAATSWVSESRRPTRGANRAATLNTWLEPSESATRAPNGVAVPSTTTIRSVPPESANSNGRKTRAAKKTGPRAADTQNHLLRTRSTNSRRITAHVLRMGGIGFRSHRGARGVWTHQIDEDLIQRRLLELELREPGPGGDQPPQDLLRVCACGELELGVLAVVVHLLHELLVAKDLLGSPGTPIEPDDEMVPAMCPLDVA